MATTTILNDLIDLNQTGNTTALKGCVGTNAQQPADPTISVQYLVVGGGGGGNGSGSGGAGAGAFVAGTIAIPNNTAVNIAVGQGGPGVLSSTNGEPAGQGQDSGFYTIQGQGGGAGVKRGNGSPGGSGAGGGASGATAYTGGSSTAYGNNGGNATSSTTWSTGGGGGAGSVGGGGTVGTAGDGGIGSTTTIISTTNANASNANVGEQIGGNLYFAGGGGGGGSDSIAGGNNLGGSGGHGGGGDGTGQCTDCPGGSAISNTGGGGGGSSASFTDTTGGNGGSGVVILRYANTATETISGLLVGGINTSDNSAVVDFPAGAGCQALYQFENNTNDSSSNNYDPTSEANISFPTSSPAPKFGTYSLYMNGSTSYVNGIPQALAATLRTAAVFTFSMWINPISRPSGTGYAGGDDIIRFIDDIYVRVYLDEELTLGYSIVPSLGVYIESPQTTSVARINLNEWSHICLTGSATNGIKFYINGQQEAYNPSWAGTFITYTNVNYKTNGLNGSSGLPGNANQVMDGNIDNFRVYNQELTHAQVLELVNMNTTTKFTESSDTVLVFKGGSGTISLTDTSVPGPKVGDLRTNTDQSSASSASAMEHYTSTGWRVINNSSLSSVNFPTVNNGVGLFQLNGDLDNSAGGAATMFTGTAAYSNTAKFGSQSINFTGSSAIDTGIAATNSFTISYWIYRNSTGFLYSYGTNDGNLYNGYNIGLYNSANNGKLDFVIRNLSFPQTNIGRTQGGATSNGQWYHIALTHSGTGTVGAYGTNTLYLNASLVTNTLTGQAYTTGNPVTGTPSNPENHIFGAAGAWTLEKFDGFMDQIRIYNTALTASQVTQLYNES